MHHLFVIIMASVIIPSQGHHTIRSPCRYAKHRSNHPHAIRGNLMISGLLASIYINLSFLGSFRNTGIF